MAETYKSIADCDHANLGPEMGGCPDCNYTVGTILAVAEDRLAEARADAARLRELAVELCAHHDTEDCDGEHCPHSERLLRAALEPAQ